MPSAIIVVLVAVVVVFCGLVALLVWNAEAEYADELREREEGG